MEKEKEIDYYIPSNRGPRIKERENIYRFMEKNKHHGIVGLKALRKYAKRKGYSSEKAGYKNTYVIFDKKGHNLGSFATDKKRRYIYHWAVW